MWRVLWTFMALAAAGQGQAESYQDSPIAGWQEIVFAGHTDYRQQGDCVLATSQDAASGLIREVDQSLAGGLMLHWRWRADAPLKPGNQAPEKVKAGDDYLARVYVIRKGFFPWQSKAINYVWSRHQPVGSHWPNPFVSSAMMVVVQSGDRDLGHWQSFSRDVKADFKRFFDLDVDSVQAVAVMTDTDNTHGQASACYQLPVFGSTVSSAP